MIVSAAPILPRLNARSAPETSEGRAAMSSLEQIFNGFAAQQEEEAAGVRGLAAAGPAAADVAANPLSGGSAAPAAAMSEPAPPPVTPVAAPALPRGAAGGLQQDEL